MGKKQYTSTEVLAQKASFEGVGAGIDADVGSDKKTSPIIQEFLLYREKYERYIIFFRIGEFYEMFFDDAVEVSSLLGMHLTTRGRHMEAEVPSCGMPVSAKHDVAQKLLLHGKKVVVIDQIYEEVDGKKVVRRWPSKIYATNLSLEEGVVGRGKNNTAVLLPAENSCQILVSDISCGQFSIEGEAKMEEVLNILARIEPSCVVLLLEKAEKDVAKDLVERVCRQYGDLVEIVSVGGGSDYQGVDDGLLDCIENAKLIEPENEKIILLFLSYLRSKLVDLSATKLRFVSMGVGGYLEIDEKTLLNLEIFRRSTGEYKNSLFSILDCTRTAVGSRLLRSRIARPSCDIEEINERLNMATSFAEAPTLLKRVADCLSSFADVPRIVTRLRANVFSVKDVILLRDSVLSFARVCRALEGFLDKGGKVFNLLQGFSFSYPKVKELFDKTISNGDECWGATSFEDIVNLDYNHDFCLLVTKRNELLERLVKLRAKYIAMTGLKNIKIERNSILGYYIEVFKKDKDLMVDGIFVCKQALGEKTRYKTEELQQCEHEINTLDVRIAQSAKEIVDEFVKKVGEDGSFFTEMSELAAKIDVASSHAEFAVKHKLIRPKFIEGELGCTFAVSGGRHIVSEFLRGASLDGNTSGFVANDCYLGDLKLLKGLDLSLSWTDKERFCGDDLNVLLITGPNMGGKSTYLRQNAIIAIMAQAGLFVPCERALLTVVDRVFSRVGSADSVVLGSSTFMLEMVETAQILQKCTKRSLVIMDEIGRGTTAKEGFCLAQAIVEHFCKNVCCAVVFATHYLELADLVHSVVNLDVRTFEAVVSDSAGGAIGGAGGAIGGAAGSTIRFTYKTKRGVCASSMAFQVAEMAGVPREIILRAREIRASEAQRSLQ